MSLAESPGPAPCMNAGATVAFSTVQFLQLLPLPLAVHSLPLHPLPSCTPQLPLCFPHFLQFAHHFKRLQQAETNPARCHGYMHLFLILGQSASRRQQCCGVPPKISSLWAIWTIPRRQLVSDHLVHNDLRVQAAFPPHNNPQLNGAGRALAWARPSRGLTGDHWRWRLASSSRLAPGYEGRPFCWRCCAPCCWW